MKQRIVAIDTLRGFALLGILLMNIMSYAMPEVAYFNPLAYGGDEWFNRAAYFFVHIFADQKFMALFSMLFGASIMLLLNNLTAKGEPLARFHYTRNFWLLLFGMAHAILIWFGDVLVIYALSSFVLYFLRNMKPKWQLTLGLGIFFLPSLFNLGVAAVLPAFDSAEIATLDAYWIPDQPALDATIAHFRGDYWSQVALRIDDSSLYERYTATDALDLYFVALIGDFFARALGMMLIGMAFFTWGITTAKRSDQFYKRMVQIGFLIGFPTIILGILLNDANGWQASYAMFLGTIPNQLGTPFVACGYIGLIMLWSRSALWRKLQNRLAAVGRMALTNYIGQSVIATSIFYGFGLGLFGGVDRAAQLLFVVAIWLFQLWASPLWLKHFRFGPLEWLWRSLSYWQIQPLRRAQPVGKTLREVSH